jgi:PAS domain S-box-containing protein
MQKIRFDTSFIKSKLARRIFVLFICCALLPIGILSLLSFQQVTQQLNQQSFKHLRYITKHTGISIYERLLFLETKIQVSASSFLAGRVDIQKKADGYGEQPIQHFKAVVMVTENGGQTPLTGVMDHTPEITAKEMQHIQSGKTAILCQNDPELPTRIFMTMLADHKNPQEGILVGEINADYLWGISEKDETLPTAELCVLDQSNRLLVSTLDRPMGLMKKMVFPTKGTFSPKFSWKYENEEYLATSWKLFLKPRYLIPEWTIVLSQIKVELLSHLNHFAIIFPLVVLLTLWMVVILSMVYIRRSLIPLAKLKEGTHRIAKSDFSSPVSITSGDEFEELADSFNTMTGQLNRQFKALTTVAEIGNATTTILDIANLLNTEMSVIQKYLDFDRGMIMLPQKGTDGLYNAACYGYSEESQEFLEQNKFYFDQLEPKEIFSLAFKEQTSFLVNNLTEVEPMISTKSLEYLKKMNVHSFVYAPIVYEKKCLGVLTLENTSAKRILTQRDQDLIQGIASQTAVSIFNAMSFDKLQESEERFRKAFDSAASGVALIDIDGRFLEVNTQLCHMLGYTAEELVNKTLSDITHHEDQQTGLKSLQQMVDGSIPSAWFERRCLGQDGRVIWTFFNTAFIYDNTGHPLYFISHIQDLTEKKKAEEEREKLETQLRQSQKMESVGTLAGGIAHDFNNILSAIMGNAQLAQMEVSTDHPLQPRLSKSSMQVIVPPI